MRAILFDLDNTLIDRGAAFVEWITPLAPADQLARLVALDAGGHGPKYPLFRAIADVTGWSVIESRTAFLAGVPAASRPTPGAAALLARLRALPNRPRLGIVTNGDGPIQRAKVRAAGLEELVDTVAVSGDVGVHKPAPLVFLQALEALDVAPADAGMVGDHPVNDVLGAVRLGLRAAWLRTPFYPDAPAEADVVIDDLRDLPWPPTSG
jgi:putative hydrolase of the HAD superfamily